MILFVKCQRHVPWCPLTVGWGFGGVILLYLRVTAVSAVRVYDRILCQAHNMPLCCHGKYSFT